MSDDLLPARMRHPSEIRRIVLITLVCVVVVFGGLEAGVRIWQSQTIGTYSPRSVALRDRFTAWRNNPDYRRVDRQINAQGFRRDQNVSLYKPPGTIRVFLTGGSVAYGWTTNWPQVQGRSDRLYNHQTISHYMEETLNAASPTVHWEVINAAVVGYQLNLDLAQTQAVLLKYKPDFIIYLDGHNDLVSLLRNLGGGYDPYASTPTAGEFELLANPGSWSSLFFFTAAWLRENSALFRAIMDAVQPTEQPPLQRALASSPLPRRLQLADLTSVEQVALKSAQSQLGFYPRLARQISRVTSVDGVKPIFVLQPELALTAKPLTDTEQRLLDFQRNNPAWYLYALQELYPQIGAAMTAAASADGFAFYNLIDIFDSTAEQAFTDDVHLTPQANRIVAKRLVEVLANLAQRQAN
jgi:hypothetical protein